MKKRINLLTLDESKLQILGFIRKLHSTCIILVTILGIGLLVSIGLYFYYTSKISRQETELQALQQAISSSETFDRKIKYFAFKFNLLKQYLVDDAQSYPYYKILNAEIINAVPSARLATFEIDNKQNTLFSINFDFTFKTLDFMRYVETPEFLAHFEYIKLKDLNLSNKDTGEEDPIVLDFEGKFKKINGSN